MNGRMAGSTAGVQDSDDEINRGAVEIIKNKLYWITSDTPPRQYDDAYFFNADEELQYEPFNKDFGPLSIGLTHRYCCELVRLLNDPKYENCKIYHWTSTKYDNQANMACMMCCFQVIILNRSAEEAWSRFKGHHHKFVPFRDASAGSCTYNCHIDEIVQGLEWAIKLGWYSFKDFDVQEYEYYERLENGDLNWIVPGKVLAFMGPAGKSYDKQGHRLHTPEDYSKLFSALNVERIVRLNKAIYEKSVRSNL